MLTLRFYALLLSGLFFSYASSAQDAYCIDVQHADGTVKDLCEKGDKNYLILEFFLPHCGACQRNVEPFKNLEQSAAPYAKTRLVSLHPITQTQSFVDQYHITTDVALGGALRAGETYGITHVPTIVVLNHNNQIIFKESGVLSSNKIQRILDLIKH